MLDPSTTKATEFITGPSQPVDIQVGADGSFYYLARGTSSVMKVRYTTNSSPVITTQPTSQLVSVGFPARFSVAANGPPPYSYQWQRNGIKITDATALSYKFATTLADNGAQFRIRVSNAFGNTLSNVATLFITSDKPPVGQILHPLEARLISAVWWLTILVLLLIKKMGILPASAFTWQVDFHHDSHVHPFIPPTTGSKTGTFTIPNRGRYLPMCIIT